MKKSILPLVILSTILFTSACQQKSVCECVAEAMKSGTPNEYPRNCEYLMDMNKEMIQQETKDCISNIIEELTLKEVDNLKKALRIEDDKHHHHQH